MPVDKTAKRLRWALGLIGVAVVVLVAYTGYQALKAKDALTAAAADFQGLGDQLTAGDGAAARTTLASAQAHAHTASENTQGLGWWLTAKIPGVGDDITAVRTVADVVDKLSVDVLPPVVEASEILKPETLRPVHGRIQLDPLAKVAPSVVRADRELQEQAARVADIDAGELAPQLAAPVTELQDKLAEASNLSDKAAKALQLLPSMLGADGKRSYLVLFQNNAELRSTGGIPGSYAIMNADHGKITLGAQGDASTIGQLASSPLPLTAEEKDLFEEKMGLFLQDVNFTPDFPRTGALAAAMYRQVHGKAVDGVISTDPVALSYMLAGTGPVTVPGVAGVPGLSSLSKLTADNALRILLNQIYFKIPSPELQNVYFNAAAGSVFKALSSGQGDPHALLDGLSQAAGERRVLVWSAHPREQALLANTRLSGQLPAIPTSVPRVGIYFNDGTAAKMDYYLDYEASLTSLSCSHGQQKLRVTLVMRSTAPRDASTLPDYVAGSGIGGSRGNVRTTIYFYAPVAGRILSATIDGADNRLAMATHKGLQVGSQTVDVLPGQTRTLTFDVLSGPDQPSDPRLRITPGVHGSGIGKISTTTCR